MTVTELDGIDLLAATWGRHVPHDQFDRLRAEAPVCWHPEPDDTGFWAITKHADVVGVSRDSATFSSEVGGVFIPTQDEEALASLRLTILMMDPPHHHRYRRLVSRGFTPRMITKLVEEIDRRAERVVDEVCEKGEVEFVEEIAAQVPVQMICEMIGLEPEVWPRMFEISNQVIGSRDDPDYQGEDPTLASIEIYALCDEVAADRRQNPRDDLMTALVERRRRRRAPHRRRAQPLLHHADRGRQRDHSEPHQPLAAGRSSSTPTRPSACATTRRCGTRRSTRCSAGAAPSTTSAGRRHGTPSCGACRSRRATRSSSTTPRPTGTRTSSPTPTRFDVGRTPNDHVTFGGGGEHFCLGASLARAEIKATMRQVVERLPDIELAGPVNRLHSDFVNGVKTMPVRFTPTAPLAKEA